MLSRQPFATHLNKTTPGSLSASGCENRTRYALIAAAALTQLTGPFAYSQDREDSTGRDALALEEIVVTAERVSRSLMDTATSVSVLDAEELERRPLIEGTNDLLGRIPNVTSSGTGNFAPAVRGVDGTGAAQGADAFLAGTRPRLNLQVDGRPASYNEVVFGDIGIWDVRQVEVLRGPQSALQGRNAIAGTLLVRTNDPTYEPEAKFRAIGGNLQTGQYSGVVSGPIVADQLAFRIAADHRTSESYIDMLPYEGVASPDAFESTTFRGKLLIEPRALEGFSTLITLNYADVKGPQGEFVEEPYGDHVNADDPSPVFEPRTTSGIIASTWQIREGLTFEGTLAYTDVDVTRRTLPGFGNATVDAREFVAEPLLRFQSGDGRLNGLAGVYFFHAEQDEFIDLFGGGNFDDSTRTAAVFGEATYAVSDRFDVTLGARFEEERRRRQGELFIFFIDLDETYDAFLPKLVLSWHPNDRLTLGTVVARGYNGGSAGFTYSPPFEAYTFEPEYAWTYEAFVRASLAGGRVSITGNAFFSDYEDMQLPFILGPQSTVIRNADAAETHGLELGARWQATRGLQLFGEVGLLETEVTEYPGSGVEGNDLPRSPALTGSLGAIYHYEGFDLSADARYSEAYYSDVLSDPRGKTDPYWIANAQVSYQFPRVRVFGFVSNVFDAEDPVLIVPDPAFVEPSVAAILRPRTYGVGVQVEF